MSGSVKKIQEIFSKINDKEIYEIVNPKGKTIKKTGAQLKSYMVAMRNQIDFTEVVNASEKPDKEKKEKPSTKPNKQEEVAKDEVIQDIV